MYNFRAFSSTFKFGRDVFHLKLNLKEKNHQTEKATFESNIPRAMWSFEKDKRAIKDVHLPNGLFVFKDH